MQVCADGAAKGFQAVIAQRQPQLQGTEAPRQLERLLEEGERLERILGERAGIVARV